MSSVTLTVGYILTVLMIHVSATDYVFLNEEKATLRLDSPFNFIYIAHISYLFMEITIENIPPSVTEVYVKHNNFGTTGLFKLVAVHFENNTGKFMILGQLQFSEISVVVELRTETGICGTKSVADGRNLGNWKFIKSNNGLSYLDSTRRYYDNQGICLHPNICNIVVDFKNTCEDGLTCSLNASQFICTIENAKTPYSVYQTYDDESTIGNKMGFQFRNLKLNITLELFDVNTTVYVAGKSTSIQIPFQKSMAANSIKDYNARTLKYFETKYVKFECLKDEKNRGEVVYLHVGVINTTNNKIKTIDTQVFYDKLNLAYNGTILCCLYYVQKANSLKELTLTRFVVNKTILIYQRNESIENVANQSTDHADRVDLGESSMQNNDYSWLLYVFVMLIGVSTLVVAFCIITKKCWFKKSQPVEEIVESDNQAHQNQVLYADLNFENACRQQDQKEESHYARIIGELHPH